MQVKKCNNYQKASRGHSRAGAEPQKQVENMAGEAGSLHMGHARLGFVAAHNSHNICG
jgi:hypothetical protein